MQDSEHQPVVLVLLQGVPGLHHAVAQHAAAAGRRKGAEEARLLLQHRRLAAAEGPAGALLCPTSHVSLAAQPSTACGMLRR